ncbi:Chk1 protein kinase [Fusarium irregulare]|uniref:histidine kinase n=1 Tax=Fusarium irregulare TaxID=2494466 RepID=A0A9W8Q1Z3_9HYPO|nr:Chk1 protein kinase [Fusarium irregulare]KAJ4025476.1 Chk1 protein kinase [Fusarium irregulare]
MDGASLVTDDLLDPPPRIYERLRQIAGYTWDENQLPFHSSYDYWHVVGTRFVSSVPSSSSSHNASSPGSALRLQSGRPSPSEPYHSISNSDGYDTQAITPPASSSSNNPNDAPYVEEKVVARVSYHALREERAFHIAKSLIANSDPTGQHIVKPLDLIRLNPLPGDRAPVVVAIYQHPGPNYLLEVLDMGPAFYRARTHGETFTSMRKNEPELHDPISLQYFLDFAIGAAQCLELLHHNLGMIHGEIRGDAFHFNAETGQVKVLSFGSGVRSFEHGLTSTGWSTLSKELGARNKLLYISPEQTGRMPAEPDSRTDIYSLGVLFWTLLTQRPVFDGDTPLDIVQGVLGRRIPNVSTVRLDIPDVVGRIIQRCTAKSVTDRYHSASGLRYDLAKVQEFLGDGDWLALKEWRIGTKDVSSFFMLPAIMIGRQQEQAELSKVIDRVAKSHAMNLKGNTNRFSDGSNLSNDVATFDDISSEGASSVDGTNYRSGSFTHTASSETKIPKTSFNPLYSDTQTISGDTIASSPSGTLPRVAKPWERHQSLSIETRSLVDSTGPDSQTRHSMVESTASSLSRQLGSAKFRRRDHCEVVTIEGAGGLGKSCLVQSVLADARRRGYCATAKFDTARRTAFGPLLKLLSSLFKQVWGERNTETPFHQGLKQFVRPVWPMLHRLLGLPEFLLGPPEATIGRSISSSLQFSSNNKGSVRSGLKRRGSSPSGSPKLVARNPSVASQSSSDFLRTGTSTKTMRLMNIFLDVLRVFTAHKFICFCLDDLHFADDESMELISQIIASRMKMVIIMTYRTEEITWDRIQSMIHLPENDEFPRSGTPQVTRITLSPLTEDDIVQYVSTTLCRPKEEVLPLALVLQSKTAGNPFYMREMLSACHRKKCIWYDYRDSQWHYDLDRLFEQFAGEKDYDTLDTAFITHRLSELPPAARTLLAWAALIGNSFSFELICRLMSGEFDYHEDDKGACCGTYTHKSYSQGEAISGLQAAIQAYIIVPSETDDRFRFAHDRYIHASADLQECNSRKMHFIIVQTLQKYHGSEIKQLDNIASHICAAVDIIQRRIPRRRQYRKLLSSCAQDAAESGAKPTAAKYYKTAVALLQDDPWTEGKDDVSYDETMQLYLRTAECYLYMGNYKAANDILNTIFANGKSPFDKAPAYVLQSRICAQDGDSAAALASLKDCLNGLGVTVDDEPSFRKCDEKFERLSIQIQTMGHGELLNYKQAEDPSVAPIGAVLSETISAAWWSDGLQFYHLSLMMVEMHLERGAYPQSGMAFLYLAMIALSRFNMTQFAVDLSNTSQDLLYQTRDPFFLARGLMLYSMCVGHVHMTMPMIIAQMEDAVEYASVAGDRISTIMTYGVSAIFKFFGGENCADLEGFCQYGCEEIPNWYSDSRGGSVLIAVKQLCRALQGKTRIKNALEVMNDETHNAENYKKWLASCGSKSNRSITFYESFEIIPLFLYGHYERAVEIGGHAIDQLSMLWSAHNSRLILLFYGLARAGYLLQKLQLPCSPDENFSSQVEEVVKELRRYVKMMDEWCSLSDINYLSWMKFLQAQIEELSGNYGNAIQNYEFALDHATEHDSVFDEALGNYLMAGMFIRRSARRSARAALLEAVGLFRQMGAVGVAKAVEEEHSLLLHGPTRNQRTTDTGVQTDFVADTASVQYRTVEAEDGGDLTHIPSNTMNMTDLNKGERIGAWRGSMNIQAEPGAGLPALDMIDLHAILVSSQVISSVLQVDELLKTMCDVILQTCGGSATLAAIVVQENDMDTWCVAASGDPERGASAHIPGLPLSGTSLIAENVILYSTRFLESVFVPDLVSDERFGNVNDSWLQRNPVGKSIIAIPICHGNKPLLGVLYLEGEPGAFTDRNVTVLQLLVNQIGISYSNALAMKNVEKISAENRSMVAVQKRALAKALEAETKAKNAEAEAKRNVKLAEEAAKAKSIFLANVSHELRTPLNGVIGNSELLRDSDLNKDQLEMADSIRVSADLLLTVINDILDFSKMEADKMKLYIIAFNPEDMVREVVRAVSYSNREKTSKKNVKIVQNINLPPMLIYGDPIRLHQVLGNLIGNSLKFTEDGSITIGARLDKETQEHATLTFWVRDTGIGIPPQQLAKLFQPFSQADASTARKYGGSGLGLSICKSLIETMMKGKIRLESEENVGTTAWFTVTFEKAKPDVAAGDVQTTATPSVDRYFAANSPVERAESPNPYLDLSKVPKDEIRICVAEDNPINQKIAIQYVQRLGYKGVEAYDNGLKAVEGLRQKAKEGRPYHVVLMDVQMPVLDGYEATKLIRKDSLDAVRTILVIAMTASAIQGDREKCLAAGMNDYLAKPVRSEILKKKLDAYLSVEPAPPKPEPSPPVPQGSTPSPHTQAGAPTIRTNSSFALPSPVVKPTVGTRGSSNASLDPMQEEAVFNQPVDSTSLQAQDSPVYNKEQREPSPLAIRGSSPHSTNMPAPSRMSSDDRSVDSASIADSSTSQKRFPRKLVKQRRSSESNSERPSLTSLSNSNDKTRGVLKKPQRQSTTNLVEEGQKAENSSFTPGKDASKRSSLTSSASSLKDRIFH